jgi:2,3-diaminopropionate biosynthesis protein SbnA
MLKRAIERGQVGPATTIIESSSGNFAFALATFCRILELKFIPVIDPLVAPVHEAFLRAQCARVVKVEECDDSGGFLKTRLRMVRTLSSESSDTYWPNQYENHDGMEAHYSLTAEEVHRSLPQLDFVFVGVSSGGTVAGVSRRLKEYDPAIKIIAVDAEGSAIFGQAPRKRYIPGIGSSIVPPLVKQAIIDDLVIIKESETLAACQYLLDRHGLFVGGSTGTVYSAIQRYFPKNLRGKRPRVLFFCCDRGTAYLHNVFNSEWAARHLNEAVASPQSALLPPKQLTNSDLGGQPGNQSEAAVLEMLTE